ncbi:thioredoxin [Aceticella autotrophica]|uniref:Thioredoxin n=1 Tax=Aceticella autotrophica TaxID=2755338 RepID=A0A974Y4A1_9THEO|nr:thioredoxin [Aceticella autotrophica]QSZ26577.1 thioredoxin [Aceticella autotrophica]
MSIIEITNQNFEKEVLNSNIPVVVDFWAEWCGPCRMVSPIIDELAHDYEGKVKVGKINVDKENELAMKFKVMSIPTIIIFRDGKIVEKIVGAKPKAEFENFINRNL